LIQVEILALSKCRSDQWQWFWCRQRYRSGDMSIPKTWL